MIIIIASPTIRVCPTSQNSKPLKDTVEHPYFYGSCCSLDQSRLQAGQAEAALGKKELQKKLTMYLATQAEPIIPLQKRLELACWS